LLRPSQQGDNNIVHSLSVNIGTNGYNSAN
jgi:hypothetical protein